MTTKEDVEIEEAFWQYDFRIMLEDLLYYRGVHCTKIRTAVSHMVEQVCMEAEKK